ncbi:MAG: SGNH/GDSL hydrolase family protein [Actinomycetota bacterium]|nr:SGNH/GDSL hydrolase family protein [Actinomycetota bacterium]
MRRHLLLLLATILTFSVIGAAPALAYDDDGDDGGTYLALGDSVAAGTQQPIPFTDGYTGLLFRELEDEYGFDEFVNLACPGDDTVEMRFGIGGASPFGSLCYGPFAALPPGGSSQLDVAVEYLATHPGEVELITITIGANDILACDPTDPPAVLNACLAAQLGQIGANLPVILGTLQALAPGVPIVAMNYYNPNLAFWITGPDGQELATQSLGLTTAFNGTLETVYGAFSVPVADVETAFKTFKTGGGAVPSNVRAICRYTLMCEKDGPEFVLSDYDPVAAGPQTDIHPSNKGYNKITSTFAELIDDLELLD